MTDTNAAAPANQGPSALAQIVAFFQSGHLISRAIILLALTFFLVVPIKLISGVIADRQTYRTAAEANVVKSWGQAQIFAGPTLVMPYKRGGVTSRSAYTLLPEKLSIESAIEPQQRRRGLFAVTVYAVTLDVTAEFNLTKLRQAIDVGDTPDWTALRLELGVTDARSIDIAMAEIEGQKIEWTAGDGGPLTSHRASVGGLGLDNQGTATLRMRLTLSGSSSLSFVPSGQRTEIKVASPWPSPSFIGNRLPQQQSVDASGFRATWSESALGRRYGQIWDSQVGNPAQLTLSESSFGVALINPVDAYRETDRTIKYAIMFIGLTFAACMLFEMATGTQPHIAQYGLLGLSLCVFYLLLLSFAEQFGFLPAYIGSAAAIVVQATFYLWVLQRSPALGVLFGAILAGLYAGLYGLLQLEEASLLSGSVLLFAVLSLAMWFTRNLHRA